MAEVFTDIFNVSLLQAEIPTCFKKTTIISSGSDFHNHELLQEAGHGPHQLSLLTYLDPLQFAYRCNRSTVNAISLALHSSLEHLDNKETYIRLQLHLQHHYPLQTDLKI
eukprot:g25527.t1